MRILIFLLSLIMAAGSTFGQRVQENRTQRMAVGTWVVVNGFRVPVGDTTCTGLLNYADTLGCLGALVVRPQDGNLYQKGLIRWNRLGGADSTIFQTIYRADTAKINLRQEIGTKLDSITRIADSVFQWRGGNRVFAFIDSSGGGGSTDSTTFNALAKLNDSTAVWQRLNGTEDTLVVVADGLIGGGGGSSNPLTLTTNGSSGAATLNNDTLNVPIYATFPEFIKIKQTNDSFYIARNVALPDTGITDFSIDIGPGYWEIEVQPHVFLRVDSGSFVNRNINFYILATTNPGPYMGEDIFGFNFSNNYSSVGQTNATVGLINNSRYDKLTGKISNGQPQTHFAISNQALRVYHQTTTGGTITARFDMPASNAGNHVFYIYKGSFIKVKRLGD